jgi:CspA family cold shock protein
LARGLLGLPVPRKEKSFESLQRSGLGALRFKLLGPSHNGVAEAQRGSARDFQTGSVSRAAELELIVTGKIRTLRVDKGFGFIKDDAGKEYFFHQSAVQGGIDNLREGDSVEFDAGQGPKGPRAENVRRTST